MVAYKADAEAKRGFRQASKKKGKAVGSSPTPSLPDQGGAWSLCAGLGFSAVQAGVVIVCARGGGCALTFSLVV